MEITVPFCLSGQCCDGYVQADSKPLGSQDYEQHMYVNTENFSSWEANAGKPEESPPKDLFDMSKRGGL